MAKWFSLLAFIIAAGAAFLLFQSKDLVDTLQKKGEEVHTDLVNTKSLLKTTQGNLEKTKADLAAKTTELEGTNAKLATAEDSLTKANAALDDIKKQIADAIPGGDLKDIGNLKSKLKELTDAKAASEGQIAALTADKTKLDADLGEVKKKNAELDSIVATLTEANKGLVKQKDDLKTVNDKYTKGIMVKNIRGRVLAVNSGWGFAVVSIGDKQGAAANKSLIVVRGGQSIGKLKISNIEANQSIADIVPNTFSSGNYVQPGDDVIYVGDESVKLEGPAAPGSSLVPPLPSHQ